MLKLDWWPEDWAGKTCLIVASGPSAKNQPIDICKGRVKCIAINNSWQLAPWADIFYACDGRWWRRYLKDVADKPAMKLTSDKGAANELRLKYIEVRRRDDRCLMDTRGVVGWGGNSGFHAINLAMQFGCKRIVLVGYDMTTQRGFHWHEDHKGALKNPTPGNVSRWRRAVDGIQPVAKQHGIEIVNCSLVSELQNYPKMRLKDAMNEVG